MTRYLVAPIKEWIDKKMILLMGPRQVGKTTLAKVLDKNYAYYNYDVKRDLKIFKNQDWDKSKHLVIFDELHKMKKWKLWLKGIYDDGLTQNQNFLVTGSARLDVAKKMGDSLAGRFFSFRMNPLDLKELKKSGTGKLKENYEKLISVSGFPEPFFEGTERFYNLWKKTHSDLILKQDMISLELIHDIDGLEMLIEMLASRVGSTISCNSVAEDLQRDDKTVRRWLDLLERMYIVFRVSPYSKGIVRSLKKSGKYYFYDCARVEGSEAQKLENLVALSLKKEIEFQEDSNGIGGQLYFIQTRDKKEIDFVVIQKNKKTRLIEVKLSEEHPSKNFHFFQDLFKDSKSFQLVKNLDKEFLYKSGIHVVSALDYLENIDFSK